MKEEVKNPEVTQGDEMNLFHLFVGFVGAIILVTSLLLIAMVAFGLSED